MNVKDRDASSLVVLSYSRKEAGAAAAAAAWYFSVTAAAAAATLDHSSHLPSLSPYLISEDSLTFCDYPSQVILSLHPLPLALPLSLHPSFSSTLFLSLATSISGGECSSYFVFVWNKSPYSGLGGYRRQ